MQRHVKSHTRILDEVIWLERTENSHDLAFLDKLIASEPAYSKQKVELTAGGGYASAYDKIDDDVLYVKIDTDIVRCRISHILFVTRVQSGVRSPYYLLPANVAGMRAA